ncbi:MAG TPA: FAD-dependent monooxygenase [Streptosporangiaceae bacterium]
MTTRPAVSAKYVLCRRQCRLDDSIEDWPDERFWEELKLRLDGEAATNIVTGPSIEKSLAPLRSFVAEPMRFGRLFLAGDAAHIVPPTGAKGLNLAIADVAVLAGALTALVRDGDAGPAGAYSRTCLSRVWRATHFSWWMTSMLHVTPGGDPMEEQLQLSQLRYVTSSRAAATTLAENYVGYPPLRAEALG